MALIQLSLGVWCLKGRKRICRSHLLGNSINSVPDQNIGRWRSKFGNMDEVFDE